MKSKFFALFTLLLLPILLKAQLSDTTLIKKLTINGSCLCQTTLTSLRQSNADLRQVDVEEMDLSKNCMAQDSRYTAGIGYITDKQPGIIFQKDKESDLVSKIRLTPKFKGKLPDGKFIDLGHFLLKDLFKIYPQLKNTWGSRGCSSYWNFSNDTLSFYVKIDSTKKPQYPADEAYYLEKPIAGVDLMMSCYSLQKEKPQIVLMDGKDPIFFIDSIRVNKRVLQDYDPTEIAMVTVFKDSSAVKIMGPQAKYGLIYIETKAFAKDRYWKYFRSKSPEYAKLVLSADADTNIQYILNMKVLTKDWEGYLASVNDASFKGIRIITKEELIQEFGIRDKDYGVIIISDVPKNLQKGKNTSK